MPGFQQAAVVATGVGGDVADRAEGLHAVDLKPHMAVGDLGVDVQFAVGGVLVVATLTVGVGLERQQVLQVDRQAIPGSNAQYQRARPLVRAQGDLPGRGVAALADQHALAIHHVAAQGEHHAVGVLRAEPVEHQRLVHGHHVGHQGALALHCRLRHFAPGEPYAGEQGQFGRLLQPAPDSIEVKSRVQVRADHWVDSTSAERW
ncbi:hypothetical protein D3C86_1612070 [compost metagenome]